MGTSTRPASSPLPVSSTSPRIASTGTSSGVALKSPATTIRASGSASRILSTSRRTSNAWLIRFIDDTNVPSAHASAVRQVKLSTFCPGMSVGIFDFRCTLMMCRTARPGVDRDVQDRAFDPDRDGVGVGRDRGQPPVARLRNQVVEQLFLATTGWWVATTRFRSLAMSPVLSRLLTRVAPSRLVPSSRRGRASRARGLPGSFLTVDLLKQAMSARSRRSAGASTRSARPTTAVSPPRSRRSSPS